LRDLDRRDRFLLAFLLAFLDARRLRPPSCSTLQDPPDCFLDRRRRTFLLAFLLDRRRLPPDWDLWDAFLLDFLLAFLLARRRRRLPPSWSWTGTTSSSANFKRS